MHLVNDSERWNKNKGQRQYKYLQCLNDSSNEHMEIREALGKISSEIYNEVYSVFIKILKLK